MQKEFASKAFSLCEICRHRLKHSEAKQRPPRLVSLVSISFSMEDTTQIIRARLANGQHALHYGTPLPCCMNHSAASGLQVCTTRCCTQRESFTKVSLKLVQAAMIRVRVVRFGQEIVTHSLRPPASVEQALQAMDLTGRMEDSANVILLRVDVMQAGEYTLYLPQTQGELHHQALQYAYTVPE